ncbi:S8 family peptidase [Microbacterium oxydans]|uniref:S8 family peptidase n=1 Tax=Microbacterium oxydans TaxID=82380 RepID=UPI00366C08D2
MPEFNPILLLPYRRSELGRKSGGGNTPAPLIDLTPAVRASMASNLRQIADEAVNLAATATQPLPVKIRLHEKALAKTRRPYALLTSVDLPVEAVENAGELVVPATAARLRALANKVVSAGSRADLYAISTLAEIERWGSEDIYHLSGDNAPGELVEWSRDHSQPIKITLFPWMTSVIPGLGESGSATRRVLSGREAVEGSPGTDLSRRATELLSIADLDVISVVTDPNRPVVYANVGAATTASALAAVAGVRTVALAEEFRVGLDSRPQMFAAIRAFDDAELHPFEADAPTVGVLDSGISSLHLEPWVEGRVTYDVPNEQDPGHGTFAAGLVIDSLALNGDPDRYPADRAAVVDAQVLPAGSIFEPYLHERVVEVVNDPAFAHVKVWNCSFGTPRPNSSAYGTFAQELDVLSAEKGILFVVAAGNYIGPPDRGWPPAAGHIFEDMIMSPSEAVNAITVGARAHKGGLVEAGKPASYTRRGPNFAAHVKPELCHWSGDLAPGGVLGGFGVQSLIPTGELAESAGTSFAAPIVSATAANVWKTLADSGAAEASPELVKGLLVHAAALADDSSEAAYRDYYGWGVPPSADAVLGNTDASFTTVHEVDMPPGGVWLKDPFPVPDCLLTAAGKFRGEVILTVSYAPPINSAFGAEAVRYEVEGAFGCFRLDDDGRARFKGITTGERPTADLWEASQIAEGKWSPTKTYRGRAPDGVAGGSTWALRLAHTERVADEVGRNQRVYAILTFRSLGEDLPVYVDGVAAVQRLRYESRQMVPATQLRLRQ